MVQVFVVLTPLQAPLHEPKIDPTKGVAVKVSEVFNGTDEGQAKGLQVMVPLPLPSGALALMEYIGAGIKLTDTLTLELMFVIVHV